MKLLRFACLFVAVWIGSSVMAQSQRELNQLMRDRGEYYFTLSVDDPTGINEISQVCSVDATDGRTVVAYANQREYDKLLSLGFQPELQTPPSLRANVTMWNGQGTYNWDSYLTYPQYVAMMEGFPAKAVEGRTCTLFSLGTLSTSAHRQLLGVRINNGNPEGKPKFLYTSTMHGDEITGMILMLRLIDELCTSTDSRITSLLDNLDIFIFPCTNPDGTYNGGNNTVSGAKRYNGNNVDLNRHFPDFDDGVHPDGASYYQDEAQWMMDLAQEYLFTMGANYHGGAEVMNYPWDTYQPVHPDDAWWRYVCREYAQLAQSVSSSYMTGTSSNGIINGYAWYTITGSRQDYMNYYGQCREVTIECSTTKTPSASQLPNFWNYNHNSMLTYMEECLNGVHGYVLDAETGDPIEGVTVTVLDHDAFGSEVSTHTVGDFHRPIKGGTYTFEFSKEGYYPETVQVTVADGQRVDLTVYLYSGNLVSSKECYEAVESVSARSYVMGYLDGSTLVTPTHNNGPTVTTTSVDVTPTDNGFTVREGTTLPQVTLTANNGQYYIQYNNRYLARSNNSLTWSSSQSSSGRWYINENGIYVTVSSGGWGGGTTTNYYLYYNNDNGSFALSTTADNNITFFTEGDCPPEQAVSLGIGWNWWTPTLEMSLADLEAALGGDAVLINSQEEGFARYDGESWSGTLTSIEPGKMYKIQSEASRVLTLNGTTATVDDLIIMPGYNWFGYTGSRPTAIALALGSGFTPTEGDQIMAENEAYAIFENGTWTGPLTALVPGKGYVYVSNASEAKTIVF